MSRGGSDETEEPSLSEKEKNREREIAYSNSDKGEGSAIESSPMSSPIRGNEANAQQLPRSPQVT